MEKTYSYEESLLISTEYFRGDELAAKVFLDKYSLKNNDKEILESNPVQMHRRIAKEFARIEKNKFKNPFTEDEIFSWLDKFKYIVPQGSQMFGIGNNYQVISLSNCYVVEPPEDSYGGILKTDQQLVQISKRRGGVGVDLSKLRPAGAPTKNAAASSTGIESWMERFSNSIREVAQNGRRGALMETIDVKHPDIEKFISIKNDTSKVTGANISVRLSDEFLNAVDKDLDFELQWPVDSKNPSIQKTVRAKNIWDKIIDSAWLRAEPGLLFWSNITENNVIDCYKDFGFKTVSTNPCSELPLCIFDSCRLLIQNLYSYIINPFTKNSSFDWNLFYTHAKISQRLMDDVIDLELEKIDQIIDKIKNDPEQENIKREELFIWVEIRKKCINGRRTGLGITATGDMLAALNIGYGTEESINFVEKVHKTQKLASFESSMEMAKEIGTFPIWNWELEKDSKFLLQIKEENQELYKNISKYGRRNIGNLTIAPTGSVSLLTQTSSGIEPLFMLKPYTRRKKVNPNDKNARVDFTDPNGDTWQEFEVYHPKLKIWMEISGEKDWTKSPWYNYCAEDIDWKNRVKLQAAAQKHIDHAISSTLNLPEDVTKEKVSEIYETAWKSGCKGITIYRKNCRTGVLVEKQDKKCEFEKRPKELNCDVYHCKVKGEEYFCLIGLNKCGNPYEVFAGKNGVISKNIEKGSIHRQKRGHYQVYNGDELILDNLTDYLTDDGEALTRMLSMALRHNVGLPYVLQQLEKVEGDLFILSKAIARCLKKYVEDGVKISGESCGECGQESLIRENGCKLCKNCGFSACG
jgi:ribonucleoside-diphosphate reductase alpha chain